MDPYVSYRTRSEFEKVFKDYCDDINIKNDNNLKSLLKKNAIVSGDTYQDDHLHRDDKTRFPLGRMNLMTYAAFKNRADVIQSLLDTKRYNVNERDSEGNTALFIASMNNYNDLVAFLLENGANPNILNHLSKSPLMVASSIGSIPIVTMLLENSKLSTINHADRRWKTALLLAAEKNHTQIMNMLHRKGATCDMESIRHIYNLRYPELMDTVAENITKLFEPHKVKQPEQITPQPIAEHEESIIPQPDIGKKQEQIISNVVKSQNNILPLVTALLI